MTYVDLAFLIILSIIAFVVGVLLGFGMLE